MFALCWDVMVRLLYDFEFQVIIMHVLMLLKLVYVLLEFDDL